MDDERPVVTSEPLMALLEGQPAQVPAVTNGSDTTALALLDFEPSPRQRAFQEVAVKSESSGRGYVRDWIIAARTSDDLAGTPTSMQEWRAWMKQPGFVGWFYDGFPLPRQMSKEDINGLDVVFWQKMRELMEDGDQKAMDLYAKITGKSDRKSDDDGGESAVVQWLTVNGGAASWRNGGR